MTLAEVIDDHVLARYRELLDAEDAAFDELEHAYEDGDREHFEHDQFARERIRTTAEELVSERDSVRSLLP